MTDPDALTADDLVGMFAQPGADPDFSATTGWRLIIRRGLAHWTLSSVEALNLAVDFAKRIEFPEFRDRGPMEEFALQFCAAAARAFIDQAEAARLPPKLELIVGGKVTPADTFRPVQLGGGGL